MIQCVVFFLVDGDMGGLVLGLFGGFNRGVLGFVAGAGPFVSWLLGRASGWSGGSGVGAGFPCGIFWRDGWLSVEGWVAKMEGWVAKWRDGWLSGGMGG